MAMMINSTALAQEDIERDMQEIAKIQTGRLATQLNLTQEQFTKVKQINLQFMSDLNEAMVDGDEEVLITEARILETIKNRNELLAEVLTEEQMSEFILTETVNFNKRRIHRLN